MFDFIFRSGPSEVFLGKGVPKICSKFTGEHPCWIVISTWVFSCKFAIYFQNTFSKEHLWRAAPEYSYFSSLTLRQIVLLQQSANSVTCMIIALSHLNVLRKKVCCCCMSVENFFLWTPFISFLIMMCTMVYSILRVYWALREYQVF